jgi:hypothetical protein
MCSNCWICKGSKGLGKFFPAVRERFLVFLQFVDYFLSKRRSYWQLVGSFMKIISMHEIAIVVGQASVQIEIQRGVGGNYAAENLTFCLKMGEFCACVLFTTVQCIFFTETVTIFYLK